jgi:hypothetical protein
MGRTLLRSLYDKLLYLQGVCMQLDNVTFLLSRFGKGILIGLGIGAVFIGLTVLLLSWKINNR